MQQSLTKQKQAVLPVSVAFLKKAFLKKAFLNEELKTMLRKKLEIIQRKLQEKTVVVNLPLLTKTFYKTKERSR